MNNVDIDLTSAIEEVLFSESGGVMATDSFGALGCLQDAAGELIDQ